MSATVAQVEAMVEQALGAIEVALKGNAPQTLALPAGTRRVLLTPTNVPPIAPPQMGTTEGGGGEGAATHFYAYRITALTATGESMASRENTIGLTATAAPVVVHWEPPLSGVPTGYRVYRRDASPEGSEPGERLLAEVPASQTSFTDDFTITPNPAIEPPTYLNVIDGIEIEGGPPPEGYEVTLERRLPNWHATPGPGGVAGSPEFGTQTEEEEYETLLLLQVWPQSKALPSAQVRMGFKSNVGTTHGQLLDYGSGFQPAVVMLVYQSGFWVWSGRQD